MENIIKNDPTLNYLVNEAPIDWYNNHQVELRCNALKIALGYYIDKLTNSYE